MPRKDFQRDLGQAATLGYFSHLSDIRTGEHDGSISFTFTEPLMKIKLDFQAIVSDTHDYPDCHSYFVFSTTDNVPPAVTAVLVDAQHSFAGLSIQDVLSSISEIVEETLSGRNSEASGALELRDSLSTSGDDAVFDDGDDDDDDDEMDWDVDSENEFRIPLRSTPEIQKMLRRDLRAVKNAGFKVGCLGSPAGSIIVSAACRIARLGISEEAMQAWNVHPSEYLVLLLRYPSTYLDLNGILNYVGNLKNALVQMHVGLCSSYKPSLEHALHVFLGEDRSTPGTTDSGTNMNPLFIGRPLNTLLNEKFLGIVGLRLRSGCSWTGAELCFQSIQGKMCDTEDLSAPEYFEPDSWASSAPALLIADHMADMNQNLPQVSLPLLAMQFTLRHFVKCTEFCLVCHCRTGDSFEALKPYVCSNPLCLYQYITLGMGPSLEYEIHSHPDIVDLLVSLTYSRAMAGKLEDFPTGLGLMVPEPTGWVKDPLPTAPQSQSNSKESYSAWLDTALMELHIEESKKTLSLRVGDWIAMAKGKSDKKEKDLETWHVRIQSIEPGSRVKLTDLLVPGSSGMTLPKFDTTMQSVEFAPYNRKFDDLEVVKKCEVIRILLDTLPSVSEMRMFLNSHLNDKLLSSWRERLSPAALDVLRWIVASNRSCIMQDDEPEHCVPGMEGYIQFRLAQGAPDKEQRFINAVKSTALHTNPKHPTLFAWHGSPLHNWHSILREGLYFKYTANGRSCGHGVYLSDQFSTSYGYSGYHGGGYASHGVWPQSSLKLLSVISLNEVVNAPSKFVHASNPYVVQHLDWIQPRYLFVKCGDERPKTDASGRPSVVYKQDPKHKVHGPYGKPIDIPISALSSRRRENLGTSTKEETSETKSPKKASPKDKKGKQAVKDSAAPPDKEVIMIDDDDNISVATAFEDLEILLSDMEDDTNFSAAATKSAAKTQNGSSLTDFVPGTLKAESLTLLSPPAYASTSATKILHQHLQATLKVQEREELHELGWYVDPDLISTVYQWIVELHSFDPKLPLAQDMKKANLKSIVLELRFPPLFPMCPPFVRVIRPRFLEFGSGGGGHVTAGGAMCMELLTNSGWLPTASIESVLLQVRMAITNLDPKPGRLASRSHMDYSVGEAVEAYMRACRAHGWEIPADIQRLSWI